MTLAQRFKSVASELLPHHASDLCALDDAIDDKRIIDEIMFDRGEYIGGMACAILAMIEQNPEF